jgi:putative oxidoreductase
MKGNRRADAAVLILRVGLGLILMFYGSQKLFGAFGGHGPRETIDFFHDHFGFPAPFAVLDMCAEFFGGLGMVVGLLTSVAAFGNVCGMAVATYENCQTPGLADAILHGGSVDISKPFFTMSILLGALAVMIVGGGEFSLDSKFFLKGKGRR